jgi:isoamylase
MQRARTDSRQAPSLAAAARRLGAHWDGRGTTFSIYSAHATAIEVCFFGTTPDGVQESSVSLVPHGRGFWKVTVPGIGPGERYGYRVQGLYAPREGHLFNPYKLLLDPYAQAIEGELDWRGPVYGYAQDHGIETLQLDHHDSAGFVPKSIVIDPSFDWGTDSPPATEWRDTIIYEAHVKGLTKLHPDVPPNLQGTYLGVAHPAVIDHFKSLGVSALELLPVHPCVDEAHIARRGLTNYWGYNSIGFFAPTARYAAGAEAGVEVTEFKQMVKELHAAGIEVILDVVYNHTGEGNHTGPTIALRGIDNSSYYRLSESDKRFCEDFTGTGNTLDVRQPVVLRLIMDSLRYWVQEMHVDGFRFDLAPALARDAHYPDPNASLFKAIFQDPVLSNVKLIAEPWDVGPAGYMLGKFPTGWSEWNGRFRDASRAYWTGDSSALRDVAYRLTGSSDLFAEHGRSPQASVNFVTAHDGFTLEDLVSYNQRHNSENGEENRDGASLNFSVNHGVEGPTKDERILATRDRHKRNLLATMFLAQGVPMLLGGDEFGRTQRGNNNAYCHDNEVSWIDWSLDERASNLVQFVRRLAEIRSEHSALRRTSFFAGQPLGLLRRRDVVWYQHDGSEMTHAAWNAHELSSVALQFSNGSPANPATEEEEWLVLLLNQSKHNTGFVMPAYPTVRPGSWSLELLTTESETPEGVHLLAGETFNLEAESIALWSWQAR